MIHSISHSLLLSSTKSKTTRGMNLVPKIACYSSLLLGFSLFFLFSLWIQKIFNLMDSEELELSQTFLLWSLLGIPPLIISRLNKSPGMTSKIGTLILINLFAAPSTYQVSIVSIMLQMVLYNRSVYKLLPFPKFMVIPLFTVLSNWGLIFQQAQEDSCSHLPPPVSSATCFQIRGANFFKGKLASVQRSIHSFRGLVWRTSASSIFF